LIYKHILNCFGQRYDDDLIIGL